MKIRRGFRMLMRQDGPPGGQPPAPYVPPAPGPVTPPAQPPAGQTPEQLAQENARLRGQVEAGTTRLRELETTILSPEYMEFMANKARGGDRRMPPARSGADPSQARGEGEPQEPTSDDLNNMSNAELANFIVGKVGTVIKSTIAPVATRAEGVDIKVQMQEAAAQFKDFWSYRGAMMQLAEKFPNDAPADLYIRAKGIEAATGKDLKDRSKPARGDAGEQPDSDRGQDPSQRGARRPARSEFGGGPSGGDGEHVTPKPKTYGEAAGRAYDKLFPSGGR